MHPVRSLSFRSRRLRHSIAEVHRKRTVAAHLQLPEIPRTRGVWAITLVRDEADVIGPVIDHLVEQGISRVLAVDHLSVDATREILASKGSDKVTSVSYEHEGYHQGTIMTALARHAARCGAEWIVPFDADEMWYSPGESRLADHLLARTDDVVVGAWWNYFPTDDDGVEPNPFDRITHRADAAKNNTKVAFRAKQRITVAYGNHRVRPARSVGSGLVVAHYPYRSREQFVRKARQGGQALRAARLRRGLGRHWRDLSELGDTELERLWDAFVETQELPFDWWTPPHHLVRDPQARLLRAQVATRDTRNVFAPDEFRSPARSERVTPNPRGGTVDPTPEFDERFSDPDAQSVPWDDARRVLEDAQLAWITTVRADGRPHVTPLVTVWLDDAVHFCTGSDEQKGRNLVANPSVVITTGCNTWDDGLDVVVEGEAVRVTDRATLERLAAAWATKWDGRWRFGATDGGFSHDGDDGIGGPAHVYAVRAAKVLAFGKGTFSQTRYR